MIGKPLLYQTKFRIWIVQQYIERLQSQPKTQAVVTATAFIGTATCIGAWLLYGIQYSFGGTSSIEAGILGDLLVSTGIALAGVSVIAFSIALFLQQSVSDLYSPQYFVDYSFDRHQRLILLTLVTVVLGQLGYGFYLNILDERSIPLPVVTIPATLVSIAIVFILLWYQYIHVARKITPSAVIDFLRDKASKQFLAFHKRVSSVTHLYESTGGAKSDQTLSFAYSRLLPNAQNRLLQPIYALSEVTMRLATRGDRVPARHGLQTLTDVIAEYLRSRKDSSILVYSQTGFGAFESDSQSMLYLTLEKLNEMGNQFLHSGQADLARGVVDSYAVLTDAAVQISFAGQPNENPIAYQLAFSLTDFVTSATNRDDGEVAFQAINVFARLGEYGSSRSDITILNTAASGLGSIGTYGIRSQVWFLADLCLEGEFRIIRTLIQARVNAFGEVLRNVFVIHQAAVQVDPLDSVNILASVGSRQKPFDELQNMFRWIKNTDIKEDDNDRLEVSLVIGSFLKVLVQMLRSSYRRVDLGSTYIHSVANCIFLIVTTCLALEKRSDDIQMTDSIYQVTRLSAWIGHESEVRNAPGGLEYLIDAACKIAMILIREKQDDARVVVALDTQFGIVRRAVKRSSGSLERYVVQLMLRLCYCGTLATRYERQRIVRKIVSMVEKFDAECKTHSTKFEGRSLLLSEYTDWRLTVITCEKTPNCEEDDAAQMAASLVVPKDTARFIAEAWGPLDQADRSQDQD